MPDQQDDELRQILQFLNHAGDLKDTLRSARTNGGRDESTAEHSWRLGLWVMVLEPYLQGYDLLTLHHMALIHDLGEAVTGDVPAIHQTGDPQVRKDAEKQALATVSAPLTPAMQARLRDVGEDYDSGASKEAALMKGLDKLETLLQHANGNNRADFDYEFNLTYGQSWTRDHPLLAKLRLLIDDMTRAAMTKQDAGNDT